MAIISISRGCFSYGKRIAQDVAGKLGYECVNREIILETVRCFNISETDLLKSLEEAPGLLNRLTHGKEKYLSCFRAALLEHVKNDNVVYHGHAGHLLLPPVRHILKVRIIADMKTRVENLQKEEGLLAEDAEKKLRKEDIKRIEWTKLLYKQDIRDSRLYDIVIHLDTMTSEDACELICLAAKSKSFEKLESDEAMMKDAAISAHIHADLQNLCDAQVTCHNGNVRIIVPPSEIRVTGFGNLMIQNRINEQARQDLAAKILKIAQNIPEVRHAVCDIETAG